MSAVSGNLRRDAESWGAQFALTRLRERIASGGAIAMRADAGLLARVDQHAAAVRDALIEAGGRVSAVGLAAYADGVMDAVAGQGWQLPSDLDGVAWAAPSWLMLRLLAVCVVAETL